MNLVLLFEHRFFRDSKGKIVSLKNYPYSFFVKRYLGTFDRVYILARVSRKILSENIGVAVEGDKVEIISLGDWNTVIGFFLNHVNPWDVLRRYLSINTAVIMSVPSLISVFVYKKLFKINFPFSLEVEGDPYYIFAPGATKHPLRPLLRWWFSYHMKRQCAHACAVLYVTKNYLQLKYPCPNYSIGVSSVYITEVSFISCSRKLEHYLNKRIFTLITVGTLEQLYKAQDILIDSIVTCVKNGVGIRLTIIGDGKYRKYLEAKVRNLHLAESINFLGQIPPGEAILKEFDKSDIFILPSRQEGLPRAMVEAMARALPCIGSTVGGIPELLSDEDMVPPNDPLALAKKIEEVLMDPERMVRMSSCNLLKAREFRNEILQDERSKFYAYIKERTKECFKNNND